MDEQGGGVSAGLNWHEDIGYAEEEHEQVFGNDVDELGDEVENTNVLEGVSLSIPHPEAQHETTLATSTAMTNMEETHNSTVTGSTPPLPPAFFPTVSNEQHIWDSFAHLPSTFVGEEPEAGPVQSPNSENIQNYTTEHAFFNQFYNPSAIAGSPPHTQSTAPQSPPTPPVFDMPQITYDLSNIITNPYSNLPAGSVNDLPVEPMAGSETIFPSLFPNSPADLWNMAVDDDSNIIDQFQRTYDICSFLNRWSKLHTSFDESDRLKRLDIPPRKWHRPLSVSFEEVDGDRYDIQGINWELCETTRRSARHARKRLYVGKPIAPIATAIIPNTEYFYRFRRMICDAPVTLSHYQLRNVIGATSNTDIVYASNSTVMHTDTVDGLGNCLMDLSRMSQYEDMQGRMVITSLAARDGIVIAGGLQGEYAMSNMYASPAANKSTPTRKNAFISSLSSRRPAPTLATSKPIVGYVTRCFNAITNHISIFTNRHTNVPHAAFCSNDQRVRILDTSTNKFINTFSYQSPINCSAISPCGRLRALVGDTAEALITDASSGQILAELRQHKDHAFATAWSDDGIHVATAAQDCQVVIYDARFWQRPLARYGPQLGCVRSLHFTPVGSGPPVLVAAEADDGMTIIEARQFGSGQVLDWFGGTAGVAVTPDGESLWAANCDAKFGGLLQYERAGWGKGVGAEGLAEWETASYDIGDSVNERCNEVGLKAAATVTALESEITALADALPSVVNASPSLSKMARPQIGDDDNVAETANVDADIISGNISISAVGSSSNANASNTFTRRAVNNTTTTPSSSSSSTITGTHLTIPHKTAKQTSKYLAAAKARGKERASRSGCCTADICTVGSSFVGHRVSTYEYEDSSGDENEDYFNRDAKVSRTWRRRVRRSLGLEGVML